MAFRVNLSCYVCNHEFAPGQMARIDGDENEAKRAIAIQRREDSQRPPILITDRTRLCFNCNRSIRNEITQMQQDPKCMRLNVLTQTRNISCVICDAVDNVHKLSTDCRINVYVVRNIYVPINVKSCEHHLDERGYFLQPLLYGLSFVNKPYMIKGQELQSFLEGLRNIIVDQRRFDDLDSYTDSEFKAISPVSKEQFEILYSFCDPVPREAGYRYVSKKDLLTFLCKLRQGLTDEFLKVMFNYSSRQATSLAISTVRKSLMQRFVPQNIGFDAITPQQFIERHVTEFSNELYNPQPQIPRVIACVDGTYAYIEKSSNFRTLKQTYCVHKGRHLVKPALIVGTDGYILAIQGPYFSDSKNNDASMLLNEFERDAERMREWFPENSIMVVDRGYRDATEFLTGLGIYWKMPSCLLPGQSQLTTEEANESRLVTKCRWIVEVRNGHLKLVFKFLDQTITFPHLHNLRDFYLICGAILNRFYPPIHMNEANAELARKMIQKSREANVIQALVEVEQLHRRDAQMWNRLNSQDVPDFPRLSLDYLRELSFGVYQVRLAPSYIQDKIQRDEEEEFQLEVPRNEDQMPGLIRVRLYSRFRNAQRYQLWIAYRPVLNEEQAVVDNAAHDDADPDANRDANADADADAEAAEEEETPIEGYYCTCKSGARTLGSCAHVASVLWFMGHARHQPNVKYPSTSLFNFIIDAAYRPPQENPNNIEPEAGN